MKSIDLEKEDEGIERFVLPPYEMSDAEKKALIEGRKELMRKTRERNKGVPMKVINKEIEEAIDEVRGRKKSS